MNELNDLIDRVRPFSILDIGIPVTESRSLCRPGPLRSRRPPHRRARIRKKWLRRYGYIALPCTGHGYKMAGIGVVGCPHWIDRLRKACP